MGCDGHFGHMGTGCSAGNVADLTCCTDKVVETRKRWGMPYVSTNVSIMLAQSIPKGCECIFLKDNFKAGIE